MNPTPPHPDEETLHACLDEALPPAERARCEAHLRSCPDCRAFVERQRVVFAMLARLPRETPSRDLSAAVLDALPAADAPPLPFLPLLGQALAALAAVAWAWMRLRPALPFSAFQPRLLEGARALWLAWSAPHSLSPAALLPRPPVEGGLALLWGLLLAALLLGAAGNALLLRPPARPESARERPRRARPKP